MATNMFKLTGPNRASFEVIDTAGVCSVQLDGVPLATAGDMTVIEGVTAGTVTASKAVVVDSNKDVSAFRNVTVTNLDAGASGTGGTVDVFPSTASKGNFRLVCADQTGNTIVAFGPAAMGQATTISIPDPGAASANVVLTAGAQTMTGVRTFGTGIAFGAGATLDLDSAAVSATGNDTTQTATVTKQAGTITTGALTTAANATTDVVLTLTGVAAGDLVFVTMAGGTNTVAVYCQSAICTSNTITVKLRNGVNATTALNGTVSFNYLWAKA